MAKDVIKEEAKSNAYADFRSAFEQLKSAETQGANLYNQDSGLRTQARDYAVGFARDFLTKTDKGLEAFFKDQEGVNRLKDSSDALDGFVNEAKARYGQVLLDILQNRKDEVLVSAPEKGLASLCLNIPIDVKDAKPLEGDKRLFYHANYMSLAKVLSSEESADNEEVLSKVAMATVLNGIALRAKEDEGFRKYAGIVQNVVTSVLTRSGKSGLKAYLTGKKKEYQSEFDKQFKGDAEKASYARENLAKLFEKNPGVAMQILYEVGNKDKKD